jgi:fatty acid desaturase
MGYAAAYGTLLTRPGLIVHALALAALSFFCVHAGFLAHEAGHGAVTRDRRAVLVADAKILWHL